jgi:uncharacterized Zn finger protein
MRNQPREDRRSAAGPRRRRRGFGLTWWGEAWVTALEQRARLDPNRLPRGRSYARGGTVGELAIGPGEVRAAVQGRRVRPYQVRVRVRVLEAEEWDRVLDAIAAQIGHAAALLDGELLPEVADDVRGAGTDLLPGPGELQPRCSCPDWADPCKHAAAVCYLVAGALDADPFGLLLLRGRRREEVLAALRARRSAGATAPPAGPSPPAADPGVDAREAYRRLLAPLPAPPLPPQRPGQPAVLPVDPPPGAGLRPEELAALAADAAARALQLATGSGDGGLSLDLEADLARRAAGLLGTGRGLAELAAAAGMPSRELLGWAVTWQRAGRGGLDALRATWQPAAATDLVEGRAALDRLAGQDAVRAWRNRLTCGGLQLRLGGDGQWYRFVRSGSAWVLDGPAAPEPSALVDYHTTG